jgi:hypothetical protein
MYSPYLLSEKEYSNMAYTPFPNLHVSEEQARKAIEARRGKPIFSELQHMPSSIEKHLSISPSKDLGLIESKPLFDGIPSPFIPAIDIMVKTPEEVKQLDINTIKTGNWLQTGYIPEVNFKDFVVENTIENPIVQDITIIAIGVFMIILVSVLKHNARKWNKTVKELLSASFNKEDANKLILPITIVIVSLIFWFFFHAVQVSP